ncbi:hypothetical protein, partial [Klebsiella pneumoniae]|uniref:hypothetical protein n=1 Tax=Klebsiella pneumoniae TaxID=573 RepID=UPI00195437DC
MQVTEGNAVPATEPSDEQDKPLAPDVGLGQAAVAVFEEEAGNPLETVAGPPLESESTVPFD